MHSHLSPMNQFGVFHKKSGAKLTDMSGLNMHMHKFNLKSVSGKDLQQTDYCIVSNPCLVKLN